MAPFSSKAALETLEPLQACVIERQVILNDTTRSRIAQCLGWEENAQIALCRGAYQPLTLQTMQDPEEIRILADQVSFYREGQSKLAGHVEVLQTGRIINAPLAYVYRDEKTSKVTKIELLDGVRFVEPERLMVAEKAVVYPEDGSGFVENVLYRFNSNRAGAILPSWGRAKRIDRLANKDYLLTQSTYTTCSPLDKAWHIEASSIALDQADESGTAKHARVLVGNVPVLYSPYLTFPTSNKRRSGFLIPTVGYSNVGGFDMTLPYYWNMAPNYDATITPHVYSRRGMMVGSEFRYLTPQSTGVITGSFLPDDKAYKEFLNNNQTRFPFLQGNSTDRWSVRVFDSTHLFPNLSMHVNYQRVSDNYYLQDFSNNLSILTERQLLQQGDATFTTDHWVFQGMLQAYQTLQPINETPVSYIYQRLPQLVANGFYDDLPFNANFNIVGQYDNYHWPHPLIEMPEGPRYYLNPVLSLPQTRPWGYITPSVELVQRYYEVRGQGRLANHDYSVSIPRYSLDAGLFFDRDFMLFNQSYTQTLEPRLYYLYVPFENQTPIPVYDSAYMIFNADQLFRTNRFSGYDRIGDSNQLSYALTTRWISSQTGTKKASFTVGQIRYFSDRKVLLCQSITGNCIQNPLTLGFLSPTATTSPIAARATYHFNPYWMAVGDYVWNVDEENTNNANFNFYYRPGTNHLFSIGYTYLVNGDLTRVVGSPLQTNALHQASVAYAWPFNDNWSTLGAYTYNISKRYDMMTLFGVQYDNCCWAVRLIGGRAFQSLSNQLGPQYNNNVYFQILLKGLGAVGNNSPTRTINTYLPGYVDIFRR